jgi:hypothetical protein
MKDSRVARPDASVKATNPWQRHQPTANAVIDSGRRVAWFTQESLTVLLGRAKVDDSMVKVVSRVTQGDRVVIDAPGRPGCRWRFLPPRGFRPRAPQHRGEFQPAPFGLRHQHAPDPGRGHGGPLSPLCPGRPDRRQFAPVGRSHRRHGGDALGLNPGDVSTPGLLMSAQRDFYSPGAGRLTDHLPGFCQDFLLSSDSEASRAHVDLRPAPLPRAARASTSARSG